MRQGIHPARCMAVCTGDLMEHAFDEGLAKADRALSEIYCLHAECWAVGLLYLPCHDCSPLPMAASMAASSR